MKESLAFSAALTWDGSRWPVKKLPAQVRAFLKPRPAAPARAKMAALFQDDRIAELRICWVPRLAGGDDVLADPFPSTRGKRVGFRAVKVIPMDDLLGVIYRR